MDATVPFRPRPLRRALALGLIACLGASAQARAAAPLEAGPAASAADPVEALSAEAGSADAAVESARSADAPDPALAGHYYLRGVGEAGSELRLRADGRFDWFLSYGALDQTAQGRWRRQGDRLWLENQPAESSRPMLQAEPAQDWTERAEDVLRERVEAEAEAAALARCPFLELTDWAEGVAEPAATFALDDPGQAAAARAERERAADRAQARQGLPARERALRDAVSELERAAAEAIAASGARPAAELAAGSAADAAIKRAGAAQQRYLDAWRDLYGARAQAGIEPGERPQPDYPPACRRPPPVEAGRLPRAQWRGGHAVLIGDPGQGMRFSGFKVRFVYADGGHAEDISNLGGWAVAPLRAGAPLRRIEIEPELGDGGSGIGRLDFDATRGAGAAIYPVRLDARQLLVPAFERMELRIDGPDLVPVWPGERERGRYSRASGSK